MGEQCKQSGKHLGTFTSEAVCSLSTALTEFTNEYAFPKTHFIAHYNAGFVVFFLV